ncbi:unnamed protein product [Kluyveromyces dobzhanskii CBS 2104]|uniref:WGS project CCBQ000000000 data, contig 00011 n=1 Tax=Kluyveromyces dobzhanskii CBS 2104 TaxID=1427455 RepID=A0A0A8L821_9SACH|nr:unnamed protein product [Kluyveromyces dobzhanskii CBS 2104]
MDETTTWIIENTGIKKNDNVAIKKSVVDGDAGGYGMFVNLTEVKKFLKGGDTRIELLRIPRHATISMATIQEVLANSSTDYEINTKIKSHLTAFLSEDSHHDFIDETNLIVVFLVLKAILSEGQAVNAADFPLYYLNEVLLKTFVPIPSNKFQDDVPSQNKYYNEYNNFPQQLFLKLVHDFILAKFPSDDYERLISAIYCSVVSRILEIPESSGEGNDDFFVSPALVPILDFANHDNDHTNAHFDIDRNTNDIVLYLDTEMVPELDSCAQVFISYSPIEELTHFEQIYGFLPKSDKPQVWCYRLDEEFLRSYLYRGTNASNFYKCMNVRPSLQLILLPTEALINDCITEFGEILTLFSQHLQDSRKSPFVLDETGRFYSCIFQDNSGAEYTKLLDKDQCLEEFFGEEDDIDNYKQALEEFKLFWFEYIEYRLEKIKGLNPGMLGSSFTTFLQREIVVLETLKRQFDENNEVMYYDKYREIDEIKLPTASFPPPCQIDYDNLTEFSEVFQ